MLQIFVKSCSQYIYMLFETNVRNVVKRFKNDLISTNQLIKIHWISEILINIHK